MRTIFLCPILLSGLLFSAVGSAQPEAAPPAEVPVADDAPTATGKATATGAPTAPPVAPTGPAPDAAAEPAPPPGPAQPPPEPAPPAEPVTGTMSGTTTAEASAPAPQPCECPKPPECPKEPEPEPGYVHDGFYLRGSIGFGAMWAKFPEGLLADGNLVGGGTVFDVQIGGSPVPGLVVGGGFFISGMTHEDVRALEQPADADRPGSVGMMAIGPFIDYFPFSEQGLHFGGMIGMAALGFDVVDPDPDDPRFDERNRAGSGGAIGAWVGYDFWVGREWSVGAQLRYQGAAVENPDREWKAAADSVALQFTALYH